MKLSHSYFYHPENKINNAEIIKNFQEKGVSMQKIQDALGRENRYSIVKNSGETSLTMAIKAGKEVLKESNISITEIDIIIFVSSTPEHTMTFDSIRIHNALNGKKNTLCYDLNANCIGGFIALDNVARYMTKPNEKALIICAEYFSRVTDYNNPITAFSFTDSALAMIIENDDSTSGLMDVLYYTDSSFYDTTNYPPNGFTNLKEEDVLQWDSRFDGRGSVDFALENLDELLEKNNLTIADIDLFLFSQFSSRNIQTIVKHFDLSPDKVPFYGKELAYTGSSSPFMALNEYQKNVRKIKTGEYILIWTLGAGYEAGLMLWKF